MEKLVAEFPHLADGGSSIDIADAENNATFRKDTTPLSVEESEKKPEIFRICKVK